MSNGHTRTQHTDDLIYKRKLSMAIGSGCESRSWKSEEWTWGDLLGALRKPRATGETVEEYQVMSKEEKKAIKDGRGFVGGRIDGPQRLTGRITERSMLTLDADRCTGVDFLARARKALPGEAWAAFTTHSSTVEHPRWRLVVPVNEPIRDPIAFEAVSRRVGERLGLDVVDPCSHKLAQFFYFPSHPTDAVYVCEEQRGAFLDVQAVLDSYDNYMDFSQHPGEGVSWLPQGEKAPDPREKPGMVGAFCRAFDAHTAIERFIPAYAQTNQPDRYNYVEGEGTSGVRIYDDGLFVYSHHATDPAHGHHNVYDMVRLHRFGTLDAEAPADTPVQFLPSTAAMNEWCAGLKEVADIKQADLDAAYDPATPPEQVNPYDVAFEMRGDKPVFLPMLAAEWFTRRHHTVLIANELHVYRDGVYVEDEALFSREFTLLMRTFPKITEKLKETRAYIGNTARVVVPTAAMNTGNRICLKNGIFDLDTKEFVEHTPDFVTTIQLPVSYDPSAKCPLIDKFLDRQSPGSRDTLYQFAGYTLCSDMFAHEALILLGDGSNGKGTFLEIVTRMLGHDNCSAESIKDLVRSQFSAANLYGKLANIDSDLQGSFLPETDKFKQMTAGDTIRCERKYKEPFTFSSRAKMLYSLNNMPRTSDTSSGWFRRLLIIPFKNKYNPEPGERAKLFTPQELSGLFNRALEGYDRLVSGYKGAEPGNFYKTEEMVEAINDYRDNIDPMYEFLKEYCAVDEDAWVGLDVLYRAFVEFCKHNEYSFLPTRGDFKAKVKANFIEIRESKTKHASGYTGRWWRGLKFDQTQYKQDMGIMDSTPGVSEF